MNATLVPGLRQFIIVFFDDILVYSRTYEEHLSHLAKVFEWLSANQWKIKLSKCQFAQRSVAYLGHIISEKGLSTDPAKIRAIMDWPTPANVKELRGFLSRTPTLNSSLEEGFSICVDFRACYNF